MVLSTLLHNRLIKFLTGIALLICSLFLFTSQGLAQDIGLTTKKITVKVENEATSQPLSLVKITLLDSNGNTVKPVSGINPILSDQQGEATFEVYPGTFQFRAQKEGYIQSISSTLDTDHLFYPEGQHYALTLPMQVWTEQDQQLITSKKKVYITEKGTITDQCTEIPYVEEAFELDDLYNTVNPEIVLIVHSEEEIIKKECLTLYIDGKPVQADITPQGKTTLVRFGLGGPITKATTVTLEKCQDPRPPFPIYKRELPNPGEYILRRAAGWANPFSRLRSLSEMMSPMLASSPLSDVHSEFPLSLTSLPVSAPLRLPIAIAGTLAIIGIGFFLFKPWFLPLLHPKGDLFVVYDALQKTASPYDISPVSRRITTQIFEPLIDLNSTLETELLLADTIHVISPTTVEIAIKKGIHFSNGDMLTASDVVFAWTDMLDHMTIEQKKHFEPVVSLKEKEKFLIEIVFSQPHQSKFDMLSSFLVYKKIKEKEMDVYLGTGPYALFEHENDAYVLKKNTQYWGKKPKFSTIHVHALLDKKDRMEELLKKNIDILISFPVSQQTLGEVKQEKNLQVIRYPSLTAFQILALHPQGLIADVKVRHALAIVLSDIVSKELKQPGFEQAKQIIPSGIIGALNSISFPTPEEVQDAQLLLVANQGILSIKAQEEHKHILTYLMLEFEKRGIHLKPEYVSVSEMEKLLKDKTYGGLLFSEHYFEHGEVEEYLQLVAPDVVYSFKEQDVKKEYTKTELLEKARKVSEHDERIALYSSMAKYVNDEVYVIPLYEKHTLSVKKRAVSFVPRLDEEVRFKDIK